MQSQVFSFEKNLVDRARASARKTGKRVRVLVTDKAQLKRETFCIYV